MCGRFSFNASKEKIQRELGDIETGSNLRINFNIAPTQHAYVLTNDHPNRLQYMTWGLIPYWSRDGKNAGKLINARSEGIASKPSFRLPIRQRRCLVLADSFYEWRRELDRKVPYRIMLKDDRLLVMAGIWDVWYKDDYAIKSFSIITTPPNKEMATIHNRMPVLLTSKESQENWLKETELSNILDMMHTPEDDILTMYRVSEEVNSVKNNSPSLHKEVPEPPTLF
jgi:putative SOS response-associated peptidase YedK